MKRKRIHLVDDDQYPLLAKLVEGSFVKLVAERSKKERSAVVKFWSTKGKFEIKDGFLPNNGEKVSLVKASF